MKTEKTKSMINIYIPRHHAIRLNSMFKAVELPAGIPNLDPCLSYVYAYYLPHFSMGSITITNANER